MSFGSKPTKVEAVQVPAPASIPKPKDPYNLKDALTQQEPLKDYGDYKLGKQALESLMPLIQAF
jgi:hypothetical protein